MRYVLAFLSILFYANFAYAEYVTQNVPNGCQTTTSYIPRFQRNTYTCANGYFLPANGTACVSCPADATCSGGTFEFNENIAQGIVADTNVTHNLSNACSSDIRIFRPVFVPNEINIVWYNSDATDVSANNAGMTVYGGNIRTPRVGVHVPGQTFVGWKFVPTPSQN